MASASALAPTPPRFAARVPGEPRARVAAANSAATAAVQERRRAAEEGRGGAASPQSRVDTVVPEPLATHACPLSRDMDVPRPVPGLSRCPEFEESACCSEEEHRDLDLAFEAVWELVYSGCPGCLENFRKLQCAIHCAPTQRDVVRVQHQQPARAGGGAALAASVRVCHDFCVAFAASCAETAAVGALRGGNSGERASPATFCAAQMDASPSGVAVKVAAAGDKTCLRIDATEQCSEELPARPTVPFTRLQRFVLAAVACCAFCGMYGIYKVWRFRESKEIPRGFDSQQPYLRQPLFVPGDAVGEKEKGGDPGP